MGGGGGNRKEVGWEVGRAQAAVSEREREGGGKRENGRQRNPPRLGGGGKERQRDHPQNSQGWKGSGSKRQTQGDTRSTMNECHCPAGRR